MTTHFFNLAPTRRDRRGRFLRKLPHAYYPRRKIYAFPWDEIRDQIDPNDIILADGEIIGITYNWLPPVGTHPSNPIDVDAPLPGEQANPIDLTDIPRTPTPPLSYEDFHRPKRGSACTCTICRRTGAQD